MCRLQKDQIPKNVDFFNQKASIFDPEQNSVKLADGKKVNNILSFLFNNVHQSMQNRLF